MPARAGEPRSPVGDEPHARSRRGRPRVAAVPHHHHPLPNGGVKAKEEETNPGELAPRASGHAGKGGGEEGRWISTRHPTGASGNGAARREPARSSPGQG